MRAPPGGRDGRRVSERVAEGLLRAIDRVAGRREACARDPARDFVRERKLGLRRLLTLLVTWGQDTMSAELARLAGWDGEAPSPSALTQQWKKLSDAAMPMLLREFLSQFEPRPFLGRYRLLAVDGTEVQLLPGTGGDRCRVRNGHGGRCVTANLKTTSWTNVGHRFDKGGLTSFTNVVSPIPPIRK